MIRGLALCAGIGGLELGLKLALGEAYRCVGHGERDAFAAAVLLARMADAALEPAPVWCGDLADLDARPLRGWVDLVSAGVPCQPFSYAGKRGGTGDERWIWGDVLRVIRECEPALVFIENVPGLLSPDRDAARDPRPDDGDVEDDAGESAGGGGMGAILGSLAEIGFDAEWTSLRASDIGAPHRRERVFILAWHRERLADAECPERRARDAAERDAARPDPLHGRRAEGAADAGNGRPGLADAAGPRLDEHGAGPAQHAERAAPRPARPERCGEALGHPDEPPAHAHTEGRGPRRAARESGEPVADADHSGLSRSRADGRESDPWTDGWDIAGRSGARVDDAASRSARPAGAPYPGDAGRAGGPSADVADRQRSGLEERGRERDDAEPERTPAERGGVQLADADNLGCPGRGGARDGRAGSQDDGASVADADEQHGDGRRSGAGEVRGERLAPTEVFGGELPAFPPGPDDLDGWRAVLAVRPDLAPALSDEEAALAFRRVAPGISADVVRAAMSTRSDQLRCYGNAVVPAQAAAAFVELWARMQDQGGH